MISNDMQNLSVPVNFLDAHYQLPLLIMSKTDAVRWFVYEKCKSFSGITSELKQDWLLCL